MGQELEQYFEDIEECPNCKGKKFKATITNSIHFYANKETEEYWEDESNYEVREGNIIITCTNCGTKIE